MKVQLDKIASVTLHADLPREVELSDKLEPTEGLVVVVKALQEKSVYDQIELVNGRQAKLSKDDVIAGALGRRRALHGFVGDLPESIKVGDRVHVLNLGGVIGVCVSGSPIVGKPLLCEVMGSVVKDGGLATITRKLPPPPVKLPDVPLVLVEGTCMSSGKTAAAATLCGKLNQRGYRVNAAKLTGVACMRDLLNMEDHGARRTMSFLDMGLPSTVGVKNIADVARTLLNDLASDKPDVIVAELGDGVIGYYGVADILKDKEILARAKAHVMCANDLVGAWGAVGLLKSWGIEVNVLAGPATDNEVGAEYAGKELRLPAANARSDANKLADIVEGLVF